MRTMWGTVAVLLALTAVAVADDPAPRLPTLFIVGDSTVKNGTRGQQGWGDPIAAFFDKTKIKVENHAIGGRSSRTFQTEGRWDKILAAARPGDFVLIQMGHNDGGPLDDASRARGTLRGTGEETREIDNPISKKKEVVHTYGWYLRKYVSDARAKEMTPVLLSPIPHRPRQPVEKGAVEKSNYVVWSEEVAKAEKAPFVNLNRIVMGKYAGVDPADLKAKYFTPADDTHTSPAGAELNAAAVVEGLRELEGCKLKDYLLPAKPAEAPPPAEKKPQARPEPPAEWIDPDTGHRVVRLSRDPGSSALYFHQNAYSADGRKLVITTPGGLAAVDLKTREVEKIADARGAIVTGRKTNQVYYVRGGAVFATDLNTRATREVVKLPDGYRSVSTLNADETLFAGAVNATDPTGKTPRPEPPKLLPQRERMFPGKEKLTPEEEASAAKEERLARRLANPGSMALFTLDARTGAVRMIGYAYAWLNHLQFSPTDPGLLMYCHEGTWHEVDRIWTVRTDGTGMRLMHKRAMDMEIAGHEFWGPDGKTIWYDLQTPRSKEFWLAGVNVENGKTVRYKVERDQWSVHYNVSPDGKRFAGDGGDPGQVAFARDGQWIYLFTPTKDGTLAVEKLVNMAKHNYRTEPNVTFTPDGQWVVFRSNMHGPSHVYAVEVRKAQ